MGPVASGEPQAVPPGAEGPVGGGVAWAEGVVSPWPGGRVEVHRSLPSTNDRARELALAGAPEGTVVVADGQTAGRGRRGRTWSSPPGQGVWCSLIVRPALRPWEWPRLVAWASLAVVRTVASFVPGAAVGVKWPNDVLVNGRKVAGILLEVGKGSDGVPFAVVGIGLNVHQAPPDFPPALRERAGSLRMARPGDGGPIDRRLVLESLLHQLWAVYREEAPARFRGAVDRLRPCSLTLGRRVRVEGPAGAVEGVAVDLTPDGLLQVRDDGGVLHTIPSGDVSPGAGSLP